MNGNAVSLQNRDADSVTNTISSEMGRQEQKDKLIQNREGTEHEKKDWQTEIKISDGYSAYRSKLLGMLVQIQHL